MFNLSMNLDGDIDALQESVRRFATDEVAPRAASIDTTLFLAVPN